MRIMIQLSISIFFCCTLLFEPTPLIADDNILWMKNSKNSIYFVSRENNYFVSITEPYTIIENYMNPSFQKIISNDFLSRSTDDLSYIYEVSDDGNTIGCYHFSLDSSKMYKYNLSDPDEFMEFSLMNNEQTYIPYPGYDFFTMPFDITKDGSCFVSHGDFFSTPGGRGEDLITVWNFETGNLEQTIYPDISLRSLQEYNEKTKNVIVFENDHVSGQIVDSLEFQFCNIETGEITIRNFDNPFTYNILFFAISNDGKYLAVSNNGGTSGEVAITNIETKELETVIDNIHNSWVFEFTHDSKNIIFPRGEYDSAQTIVFYDFQEEKIVKTYNSSLEYFVDLCLSDDGTKIICDGLVDIDQFGRGIHVIEIIDLETGGILFRRKIDKPGISTFKFSPDGSQVCAINDDGTVSIFESSTGNVLNMYSEGLKHPRDESISFSADNNYLSISNYRANYFNYYNMVENSYEEIDIESGEGIYSSALSPDGKSIAYAFDNKKIIIKDIKTEEILYRLDDYDKNIKKLEYSHDGEKLIAVTYSHDPKITVEYIEWNYKTGSVYKKEMYNSTDATSNCYFSANQRFIGLNDWYIYDLDKGKYIYDMMFDPDVYDLFDISSDGKYLAFVDLNGSWDSTLKIRDFETDSVLHQFSYDSGVEIIGDIGDMKFGKAVDVKFSPNDSSIATLFEDGTLIMWKVPEELLVGVEEEENFELTAARIFPNPASDFIELHTGLQPLAQNTEIRIFSALGQCVMRLDQGFESTQRISISHLPAGIYFLKVETAGKYFSKSFVISH